MEWVMDSAITERLWFLYSRHVEQLESDACKVREAFGFNGAELINVPRMTRLDFEEYLLNDQWERETRIQWLTRIIEHEGDDKERNALRIALGLELPTTSVSRPHFFQEQKPTRKEPVE
jgi:hypothetical protein